MKAMLLAAGRGTRLRPLTNGLPKCMLPVCGRPLLEHNLVWLQRHGITEVVINLFHLPEIITGFAGDGSRWGLRVHYLVESQPLGTAGGVKHAASFFDDGAFLVFYADNLTTCNLTRLVQFHEEKGSLATIALSWRQDVLHSGIADLDSESHITRFLEKPLPAQVFSHWVNAGIYILEPAVLECIPSSGTPDFGYDIFPALLAQGRLLSGYRMKGEERLWWVDTLEDYQRVLQRPNEFGVRPPQPSTKEDMKQERNGQ